MAIFIATLIGNPISVSAQGQAMSGEYTIGPDSNFKTFTEAMDSVKSRYVDGPLEFIVKPGTYEEQLYIPWIQTPSFLSTPHTTTFRSESGNAEDVILTAGGFEVDYVIAMHTNARNIIIENITIEAASLNTIPLVIDGRNHRFTGLIFKGAGFGNAISGGDHTNPLAIENCILHDGSIELHGANMTPGLGNVRISGNTLYNGRIEMNRLRGAYSISENIIHATNTGILVEAAPVHGKIFNNYIRIESESSKEALFLNTVDSVLVYHNTLKSISPGTPFKVAGEANILFKNNILYTTTGKVIDLQIPEAVTADYNGYYTGGTSIARFGEDDGLNFDTFEEFISASEQNENSIFSNPLFDEGAEDEKERMMPLSSDFATAGRDLTEYVPLDLLGNERLTSPSFGAVEFSAMHTTAEEFNDSREQPTVYKLHQNYPNPFNPTTQIQYSIPEQTQVKLTVYNTLGQLISTLVNESKSPGRYEVSFEASGLSSGLYLYRLQTESYSITRRMLLVK